ncbi:hypothetical protein H6F93_11215 [Leptolyngbya sp. FACHB-671]|uniref:hypothetical protein n=1 Tax=Leptolyngbya sp. FACHB-671 TaxID=2692812 RepID=UPI00168702BF|nr:hypothetical protein [Leptolyngbya sp. FACHB-671]MBD2068086.1 hypothetical protein [Leptolyngbya sp. FACHB-671]
MISIDELIEAARTIRPVLPTLLDDETAQHVDQQLAELLNQAKINDREIARPILTLLQSYDTTKTWLVNFSNTGLEHKSIFLGGDPASGSAIQYVCPTSNDFTIYREANEDIPLCPTHLVPLVRAQP